LTEIAVPQAQLQLVAHRRPPTMITPLPQSLDEPTMFATSGKAGMRQQHDWCLCPHFVAGRGSRLKPTQAIEGQQSMT